jgi:hypothetical protein
LQGSSDSAHQGWNPAQDLAETITTKPTKNIFFAVFAVQFLMWLLIRSSRVNETPALPGGHGDFVQASKPNRLNNFCSYSVICDLLMVICNFFGSDLVENLIKENRKLACILGSSIRTAQAKTSRIDK